MIISEFQGIFPNEIDDLVKLPGIGRTTAGAIKSLAFDQRGLILDGNVKRVLSRYHKIEGWSGSSKTNQTLWFYADKHTPNTNVREYTQAIMDIGATVCKKNNPCCTSCPIHEKCKAFMENEVLSYPAKRPHKKIQERSCYFLIIKDKNSNNYSLDNIQLLCYNHYFLTVGDIFNKQDVKQIESQQEHYGTTENIEWEVDDYHLQRLKELGLDDDEDDVNQYISRI